MDIIDQPDAYDNNGREVRILEAVKALDLNSPDLTFGRGLTRSRTWRVTGVSKDDLSKVADAVWAIVPSAVVYPGSGEIEWQNL